MRKVMSNFAHSNVRPPARDINFNLAFMNYWVLGLWHLWWVEGGRCNYSPCGGGSERWPFAGPMLNQRLRRWANIDPAKSQRTVPSGLWWENNGRPDSTPALHKLSRSLYVCQRRTSCLQHPSKDETLTQWRFQMADHYVIGIGSTYHVFWTSYVCHIISTINQHTTYFDIFQEIFRLWQLTYWSLHKDTIKEGC